MDLLFKREQTSGSLGSVHFKLWGKLELTEEERALIDRYNFDQTVLIAVDEPDLLRRSVTTGLVAGAIAFVLAFGAGLMFGMMVALVVGCGVGSWYMTQRRETIYVRDLLHGRHFKCESVIELAKKEAWLTNLVTALRQVMVSAKHWDGTEQHAIEALDKDEAKQMILEL